MPFDGTYVLWMRDRVGKVERSIREIDFGSTIFVRIGVAVALRRALMQNWSVLLIRANRQWPIVHEWDKVDGKITKNVTGRHLRIHLYGLELGIRNYPANWVFFETSNRLVEERRCAHLLFAWIERFQWIENCGAHFRREHDQWIMGSISIFPVFSAYHK